ncbi:chorismate synthase 2, chloroplastic-like [Ipomoea triloba]|uniref:chorismate synthase 2, chloroplastic-like n=1 Tax=Ipomoea triloba TaxID=35885 RepID=UPI00125DD9D7|nr:chorismate synthase 2, chloroplastic-like [Ipomoea triloba]
MCCIATGTQVKGEMSFAYRPSHVDATYDFKYGVRSVKGGGRSSARETIGRVAAGAVAKKILKQYCGTEVGYSLLQGSWNTFRLQL